MSQIARTIPVDELTPVIREAAAVFARFASDPELGEQALLVFYRCVRFAPYFGAMDEGTLIRRMQDDPYARRLFEFGQQSAMNRLREDSPSWANDRIEALRLNDWNRVNNPREAVP